MIFLNLGCGGVRPPHLNVPKRLEVEASPWINVDNLHAVFPNEGCPERLNMDAESNYVNCDLLNGLSFENDYADGIFASHLLEHLDLHESIAFIAECKRVLKPGGVLRISVPCAKRFHELSVKGAGPEEWGEPSPRKDISFMEYALFFNEHKQILSADGMYCLLWHAGFTMYAETVAGVTLLPGLEALDNRPAFSVFVEAKK